MKDYYKILIDGMDDTLTVTGIVRGVAWVGAELSNGSFGIAMNTEGESVQRKFASLVGLGAKTAAQAVMSWSFNEASEAMAVINAYYNTPERMERLHLAADDAKSCTDGMDIEDKTVALIGHLKLGDEALKGAKEVYIIERDPRDGDLPDSACEYILPECDVSIITGSAAVNKTMPRLLELSRNAKTVVIGPTVPMCPELKSLGIDRLSGMVVTDKAGIVDWMRKVRGTPYPFGKSFTID